MKSLTTTLTLILALGIANDADARRRTVDNTPPPTPSCSSGGVIVDCTTYLPVETVNVVTLGMVTNELISPIPPNLSLNTTRHTLQQFNDSRVAPLHNRVAELINQVVQINLTDNRRMIDEIQVRLDPLADGANVDRIIDPCQPRIFASAPASPGSIGIRRLFRGTCLWIYMGPCTHINWII